MEILKKKNTDSAKISTKTDCKKWFWETLKYRKGFQPIQDPRK